MARLDRVPPHPSRSEPLNVIRVGLIGLGDDWDVFRAALDRSRERVRVVAVHDAVAAIGRVTAEELSATHFDGIRVLVESPKVDAVFVNDLGPLGLSAIRLASSSGKPVLVRPQLVGSGNDLRGLATQARESSRLLVPALGHRYSPSTGRLRELTATTLGHPRRVRVDVSGANPLRLAEVCDWCVYVLQATPVLVRAEPLNGQVPENLDDCRIEIEFATRRRSVFATLEPGNGNTAPGTASVTCENGSVEVETPRRLFWRGRNGSRVAENLDDERAETDVMLDQFCRRVVGGLVPVPDFEDLGRALDVCRAAELSRQSGEAVPVEGETCG